MSELHPNCDHLDIVRIIYLPFAFLPQYLKYFVGKKKKEPAAGMFPEFGSTSK